VIEASALTAAGDWVTTIQAAANTYTETDATLQAIWVVDIAAESLDSDGGYSCIRVSIGDVGSQAQLGCAFYLLHDPRFEKRPPRSAIV